MYHLHGSYKFPILFQMKNNKTGEMLQNLYLLESNIPQDYRLPEYEDINLAYQNNSSDVQEFAKDRFKSYDYAISGILENHCPQHRVRIIYLTAVSSKSVNYDDLDQAMKLCSEAFANSSEDDILPAENDANNFKKAIEIWEKALKEADYDNKKARINEKVAASLYENLANIYSILGNFDKAKEYSEKCKEIGGVLFKVRLKEFDEFIEILKHRFEANNISCSV